MKNTGRRWQRYFVASKACLSESRGGKPHGQLDAPICGFYLASVRVAARRIAPGAAIDRADVSTYVAKPIAAPALIWAARSR